MAEKSFRFYRNVGADEIMPENVINEWDELRKRVEELVQTENKVKSNFEYKDLCKFHHDFSPSIIESFDVTYEFVSNDSQINLMNFYVSHTQESIN